MSKTYYNQTIAITARPRSKRLREAGGYYAALAAGKNAGSNVGQTVVDGGLSGLFEEILDASSTIVGIKALHDLHIITVAADEAQGITEETRNISEIMRHLSLEVVNEGEPDEETVLVCDITMGSMSEVFAGGIGTSGGGSGGGSIATLVDVSLSSNDPSVLSGRTLTHDGISHWVDTPFTLAALADTSIQGTPATGSVLKFDGSAWAPGTVAGGITSIGLTMPTGFSVAGSPLTTDGTISVTFASGYGLVTDTERSNFHSHSNKSTLDGINSTKVSRWDAAWDNIGIATVNTSNETLASRTWVNNQGFLTSHQSLSGYATQSWVGQQGYLTSAVTSLNSLTGAVSIAGGSNISITKSGNTITIANTYSYSHPTGGANTTINAATGRVLSAITVDSYGHTTSVSYKALTSSDIPDLSGVYLPLSGGTLTGDLRIQYGSYGRTLFFGDGSYVYLNEDTDDHLVIYADKGMVIRTKSSSYGIDLGASGAAAPVTIHGTLTVGGNETLNGSLTVGTTSANKTVTIYGSSSAALTIYGGSRYSTDVYRTSAALAISSAVAVAGNIDATGNITADGQVTAGAASDRRLKEDIKDININAAAEILAQLRPVDFRWNVEAERLSRGKLAGMSRGFLADEYLTRIPNAGRKIWGEYDAIDYDQSIPYLVGGWQQHNMRIRILEGNILVLKQEINRMRRMAQ